MQEESKQKLIAKQREIAKAKLINDNMLPKELLSKQVQGLMIIERKDDKAK